MKKTIAQQIAEELSVRPQQVDATVTLIDEGATVPPDFLYLPLMLGALRVVNKVHLPDEDVGHTIQLIQAARQERQDVFIDEDMAQANQVFNHLMKNVGKK